MKITKYALITVMITSFIAGAMGLFLLELIWG